MLGPQDALRHPVLRLALDGLLRELCDDEQALNISSAFSDGRFPTLTPAPRQRVAILGWNAMLLPLSARSVCVRN